MAIIEIEGLSFAYPQKGRLALDNVSLKVNKGSFVLICGQSGSGKTTLLRMLKTALAPHGIKKGKVYCGGKELSELSPREQAQKIGFVMQDPEEQVVTDKVWHELAFGLENLNFPQDEIRLRVAETAAFFGISDWFRRDTAKLSGGQKQLLSLAAVTALRPEVIMLDEPTARLDPLVTHDFLDMLGRVNSELGITVVISEHRLDEVFRRADKVAVMDGGRLINFDTPQKTAEFLYKKRHPMLCALPAAVRIGTAAGKACMTVSEASAALENYLDGGSIAAPESRGRSKETVLRANGVYFGYERSGKDILKNFDIDIKKGDFYALLGSNGSGKTTALKLLAGLLRPYRGSIKTESKVLLLPQEPADIFTHKTVYDDLCAAMESGKTTEAADIAELTQITDILGSHPFDISGGELQRAAIAKLLLSKPDILLLDEPTKGIDDFYKQKLGKLLIELTENGLTVVVVSHDTEFCAEYANRCAMLFDTEIVSEGEPHEFFPRSAFYTTDASRISRPYMEKRITTDEVLDAMGKKTDIDESGTGRHASAKELAAQNVSTTEKRAENKRTVFAALMILLLIPITLFFGMTVLNDRKYYFISVIIIFMTMLPFFMIFEDRLARTRELMLIAMICALTCLGRAAFFMVPEFKPMCAMIIISGACLGAEAGFMTGAVSGFVSNFFFGQGPWTPWQMFTLGIIGFLSGILSRLGLLGRSKASLAVFGFLAVLFIYGGIMNPASVIMYQPDPSMKELLFSYISGFPVDMIHAVGTSVFLVLIGGEMIEKIERVKVKFGLLQAAATKSL